MSSLLKESTFPMFEFRRSYYPSALVEMDNLVAIGQMDLKEGDIFLTSFPRSGSMWTQAIVWSILNSGKPLSPRLQLEFPHLELLDYNFLRNMSSPRTFKTHMASRFLRSSDSAKYICIVRNIFDCCLSSYEFFLKNCKDFGSDIYLSLDRHVDFFVEGLLPMADYFDVCRSWYERRDEPNVLFLTYEEQKKDIKGGILKIAKFLGQNYYDQLTSCPEMLEQIIHNTGINSMKESKSYRFPDKSFVEVVPKESNLDNVSLNEANSFAPKDIIFKGEVGRGLKGLSEKHRELLRGALEEKIQWKELRDILGKLE